MHKIVSYFLCILYVQASEDAKKLVNQEKSFACAEIESARAVVQRIGEALDEQDTTSEASKKQVSMSSFSCSFMIIQLRFKFWPRFARIAALIGT